MGAFLRLKVAKRDESSQGSTEEAKRLEMGHAKHESAGLGRSPTNPALSAMAPILRLPYDESFFVPHYLIRILRHYSSRRTREVFPPRFLPFRIFTRRLRVSIDQ